MQIKIEAQDKRPNESVTFQLSAGVAQRLRDYSQSLNDSKPDYVLEEILQQVLPAEKKAKAGDSETNSKPKSDAARKPAGGANVQAS